MRSTIKKEKRGQAAIEFLVTYGWAILGVMITIGALAYFGIFNTQKYVNDVCYFGDQMTCEDYAAYQNGTIAVQLRNNFGIVIDVDQALIKSDYGTKICNKASEIIPQTNIAPGSLFEIKCDITDLKVPINNKLKYKTTVTFKRSGSTNAHNQTGDVTVTVQKSP